MSDSRADFEAWAKSNSLAFTMSEGTLDDLRVTSVAFSAWQAGRASMQAEAVTELLERANALEDLPRDSDVTREAAQTIKELKP
jgi:hypothetical protein